MRVERLDANCWFLELVHSINLVQTITNPSKNGKTNDLECQNAFFINTDVNLTFEILSYIWFGGSLDFCFTLFREIFFNSILGVEPIHMARSRLT